MSKYWRQLPLHHKIQKFSSGTGSHGWSRKKGHPSNNLLLSTFSELFAAFSPWTEAVVQQIEVFYGKALLQVLMVKRLSNVCVQFQNGIPLQSHRWCFSNWIWYLTFVFFGLDEHWWWVWCAQLARLLHFSVDRDNWVKFAGVEVIIAPDILCCNYCYWSCQFIICIPRVLSDALFNCVSSTLPILVYALMCICLDVTVMAC